jgi:putative PIG3 family NAD(P)H quinone oxidoreductase
MTDHDLPETMTAVAYDGAGGREVVSVLDRPVPSPAAGEVVVRVAAAGINNADLMQRQGIYPPPPGASDLPGLEVSGTVAAVGDGVTAWQVGDEACALLAGGGYAQYVTVPAGQLAPIPRGISLRDAAALPEVAATTWANLVMHAGAEAGETALIHGGSGGIGSFAVQLMQALGLRVITTAGGPEKTAYCRSLGVEHVIDYRSEDFAARTMEITGGRGADVILDLVGGPYLNANVQALATGGRLVIIGLQGGPSGELAIGPLMGKRAWVTGTTIRARSVEDKSEIMRQVAEHVWPLVEQGLINPQVSATFALTEAADAQDRFKDTDRSGKILLHP